jgi:hypothetical protein
VSRGKVQWNGSGRGHKGSAWWPVLSQGMRGAVIAGGKVVDGRMRVSPLKVPKVIIHDKRGGAR